MFTGEKDINTLGDIKSWNGKNRTEAFRGECGRVMGSSDGLLAPGKLKMLDRFDIWSTDTCRTFTFEREGTTQVNGISVDKFKLADNIFDNGTLCKVITSHTFGDCLQHFAIFLQENECYENNLPTGVQNVSQCKMKAPAYLSRPHFAKADSYYARQFQVGIHPETERHDSYFLIEPHTSVPLEVTNIIIGKQNKTKQKRKSISRLEMLPLC